MEKKERHVLVVGRERVHPSNQRLGFYFEKTNFATLSKLLKHRQEEEEKTL